MNWLYDIGHSLWLGSRTAPKGQVLYTDATTTNISSYILQSNNLPQLSKHFLRIVCLSDTHEKHNKIDVPPGDVLIIAGDILLINRHFSTAYSLSKLENVAQWMQAQPHQHKIIIGGNHDLVIETAGVDQVREIFSRFGCIYLEDNGVKINCNRTTAKERSTSVDSETKTSSTSSKNNDEGEDKEEPSITLSVYGSPTSRGHSANDAFQSHVDERLAKIKSAGCCDILVTHGPLSSKVVKTIAPLIHVYGHVHERYGIRSIRFDNRKQNIVSVCASIMDGRYHPSHSPIVVDIPTTSRK